VVTAAFSIEEIPRAEPVPLWRDPDVVGLAKSIGAQVGLVLLGLMAILFVIRPALRRLPPPPPLPGQRTSAVVADDVALPAPTATTPFGQLSGASEAVIQLARDNPATVANVVRSWVNT
jgi:flagellar M-ring protein FliF